MKEPFLWIDISDTYARWKGSPTGIQRTLIGLASATLNRGYAGLCVWDPVKKCFRKLEHHLFQKVFENEEIVCIDAPKHKHFQYIKKAIPFSIRSLLYNISPFFLASAYSKAERTTPAIQKNQNPLNARDINQFEEITLHKDDKVLIADSSWNQNKFITNIKSIYPNICIIGFCYDIIPIERPDFVSREACIPFKKWVDTMLKYCSEIVCISTYTAERLLEYRKNSELKYPENQLIRPILFGNKSEEVSSHGSLCHKISLSSIIPVLEHLKHLNHLDLNNSSEWILWVGSVDVRKNLDVLLHSLEHLIQNKILTMPVLIVGRPSNGADYYLNKIRNNPLLNRWVVFIPSPSDELLEKLFIGAALFVFTSWEEGYGLPVAEALQYQVPVIASNATSIPEVAGGLVEYFEPWNSQSLASLLERFLTEDEFRNELKSRTAEFVPTTWEQTLDDIVAKKADNRESIS